MRMTSSRVLTSASFIFAIALSAPLAFADQKDDLYKKGTNAANAGDIQGAKDAFCALPADFNDAAANCKIYTDSVAKALNKSHLNYGLGMTDLANNDFAAAEIKFKNVKMGPDVAEAQKRLNEIPALKQKFQDQQSLAANNAAAETQNKQKFDQGIGYFNGNDYPNAEKVLSTVTGSHQGEAQATLNKIRSYNAKMSEAQQAISAKNFAGAASAYGQAIAIAPNGPGNPQGAMADAMRMASAASQPVNPPVNNPATRPQPTVRTIDVAAYMRDGQKSLSKKDYKRAKRFFQEVLGQEPNNQEAKDAIAQINATDTSTVQASDDDPQLSRYIGAFYSGQYATAEQLLNTYIFNSPRGKGKLGLANFYLGASMMTRYYLTGANDTNLKREAETKFKAAKAVDGFAAPEKFVSPKIMKAFQEAS